MFEQALSKQIRENLALLGEAKILKNAYLAGGTALALQLGHRVSYDLDFFTNKKFKAQIFLNKISQFKSYKHERLDWGTILGKLGDVKFSLFYYSYPLLEKPFNYEGIGIAGTKDIAAMKLAAISERGAKRDFIDLYFILQTLSLIEVFNLYDKKYKKLSSNLIHIRKSLTYFADADKDNMPDMIKRVSWKEIIPRILGRAGIFKSFILVFQENQKRTGFLKEGKREAKLVQKTLDKIRLSKS